MEPVVVLPYPALQRLVVRPVERGEVWSLTDVYVELVWAHRLGPSATLAVRQVGRFLERFPSGGTLNLDELAKSLGVATPDKPAHPSVGRDSTIARVFKRLTYFGLVDWDRDAATISTSGSVRSMSGPELRLAPPSVQKMHYALMAVSAGIDLRPASTLLAAKRLQTPRPEPASVSRGLSR